MRTALLTWFYPPGGSGLGRAAEMIARGLIDNGSAPTVFTASLPYGTRAVIEGVPVIGCAAPSVGVPDWLRKRAGLGHLIGPWYFRRALMAEHASEAFELVEATNWYAPASLVRIADIPLVVRNSTPAIDAAPRRAGARDRVDMAAVHHLERRTARMASGLISNTASHKALIDDLYRLSGDEFHRVLGLALSPDLLARAARTTPKPSGPATSLLFVGRDERRKGFREMLQAYLKVLQRRLTGGASPIRLTLVGVDRSVLTAAMSRIGLGAELAEHIKIHPSATDPQLYDLYDDADIVLAPSRYESYGLVYREAAAFGCTLVACAEDPAATQFIATARCGVLAATCTAQDIAVRLDEVIDSPELRAACRANGQAHAQTLSRKRLGAETLDVYQTVLRARAAAGPRRRFAGSPS